MVSFLFNFIQLKRTSSNAEQRHVNGIRITIVNCQLQSSCGASKLDLCFHFYFSVNLHCYSNKLFQLTVARTWLLLSLAQYIFSHWIRNANEQRRQSKWNDYINTDKQNEKLFQARRGRLAGVGVGWVDGRGITWIFLMNKKRLNVFCRGPCWCRWH